MAKIVISKLDESKSADFETWGVKKKNTTYDQNSHQKIQLTITIV